MSSVAPSSVPENSSVAMSSADPSSVPASSAASAVSSVASSQGVSSSAVSSSAASVASSSSANSSSAPVALTGVFIDSAVAGVSYETSPGGFTGVTSVTGQYQFAEGDTVVFSIGAIEFPPVTAKGVVTPVDMVPSGDTTNPTVVNIAVLLQSLDEDGDASNGISIPAAALAAATQSVDFTQAYSAFSNEILPVVQHTDTNKTVVAASAATTHLEASLTKVNADSLAGTWYIEGETYKYALFILDGSHYAAVDYDASEASGLALETGTYEWNQETGVVTIANVQKTESGLDSEPPMANGNTLTLVDSNTLTFEEEGGETFELHRLVSSAEHPLKSGWSMSEEGNLIVFAFTNEHYLMGQQSEADGNGESGAEVGTYTYNLETKAIVPTAVADSNGQWGLSHSCAVLNENNAHPNYEQSNYLACGPDGREIVQTLKVTGDTLTFISEADTIANNGEEDPFELERVNGLPDGDIHLKLTLTVALTEYTPGAPVTHEGATSICGLVGDMYKPGYSEVYDESWVLAVRPDVESWMGPEGMIYDPETHTITNEESTTVKPVEAHAGYFDRYYSTFEATYTAGESEVITGVLTQKRDLSWGIDGPVSTCVARYSVTGVLR
jgi:hypothetical protein